MTDPLYAIFTSGSTGLPKGVLTSHQSLIHYLDAYAGVMKIDDTDIFGNQSPLDYIAAVRDIYLPLRNGASTVIIPKQYFSMPKKLIDLLNEKKVSAVGWSVSAMSMPVKMGALDYDVPRYLKKVCFSGSVMPGSVLRLWQEKLENTVFVNQYGPTEATASCTCYVVDHRVSDDEVLPIGRPYENYRVFLLKADNTEAKAGEEGEICIAGPILALGYLNDPERTKKQFIQNPLNNSYNEPIYKSGDIGVRREDGILEFHGRLDRQIKYLGHRVELDEIETAALAVAGVNESSVIYREEKEIIVLFYAGTAAAKEIAVYLRNTLPGFMVPRKMIKLPEIPKLPNGKTDMQTLKNTDF